MNAYMETFRQLRTNLNDEAKAYGYTLSIWGSGAFLLTAYNSLTPEMILLFVLGGVVGFGLLAVIAFHQVFRTVENPHEDQVMVAASIHILAAFGNVLLSYSLLEVMHGVVRPTIVFFAIGFSASYSYNIFLLLETYISEHIIAFEAWLAERWS